MTKASELRELTDDVLELRLAEAKDELFKLRFGHATGQLDDVDATHRWRGARSRGCTRLRREREIAAHEAMREDSVMADDAAAAETERPQGP